MIANNVQLNDLNTFLLAISTPIIKYLENFNVPMSSLFFSYDFSSTAWNNRLFASSHVALWSIESVAMEIMGTSESILTNKI